ncbi:MAG: nucleotidyltransferase family protein [Anaerolineae bacterium]|nr:nucleotidyltransferase family protein [Anaerolineae bacterium]
MISQAKIPIPTDQLKDLCRRYQVRRLALFGSVLRDDFGPESDVDILVDFEPDAEIGFMELSGMQLELAELFHRPVDLVPRDGLKPLIRPSVLSSAELIYEN